MKTIQARVDENVDALIRSLNALVGEVAMDALARRMQQKPSRCRRRAAEQVHRKPEEIGALAEELYAQICLHPGETMLTLSTHLKQPPKVLAVPARKLVDAGRVKKAGQRQFTRYFPIGQEAKRAGQRKAR